MIPKNGRPVTRDCDECPIRHRAVCSRCDTDELFKLEEIKYYRRFDAGQTVVFSGDRMDFVGTLVSGIATLMQTMEDGRTQMVGLLLPSDFVGRPGRNSAAYDVVAATDLEMCCFRKVPFENLLERTPHIAQRLLEMSLDELDAARDWMMVLGRKNAREKIASLLSIVANRDASLNLNKLTGPITFEIPVGRRAMADYLGLAHETVSRQVTALRKDGVITLEGKRIITIPDMSVLFEEAGFDTDDRKLF